ncbi:hypothetical protein B0H13DRAFT_1858536 [Mycena leptocephala]|nr:hypothetical protein B0H13DRAFT_1858536 [Mycena leptocephala]
MAKKGSKSASGNPTDQDDGSDKWHAQSTITCPGCQTVVKVGFAGHSNYAQHKIACDKNLAKPAPKKPVHALLSNFFFKADKAPPLVPSTVAAPAPVQGLLLTWFLRLKEPVLSLRLRAKIGNIPAHTPLASSTHPLAIFTLDSPRGSPVDDWDCILHPLLKRAFGVGELDINDPIGYINLGEHGLTGFCTFFEYFVMERQLEGRCILPYFDFLLEGTELRFPTASDAAGPRTHPKEVRDELHRALAMANEDFAPEIEHVRPCTGLDMVFPTGRSHHVDYPFGLHKQYDLPWDYYSKRDQFFMQSQHCLRSLVTPGTGCAPCEEIIRNDIFRGIMQRIGLGIHENTPLIYMPIASLIDTVRKKTDQCRGLKLTKLNVVCKLLGKMAALDEHKQFVMAIASGRLERVAQLVQACLNNGMGIRGLVERYERACREVYNPKGFTKDDMMLGLLILRLGGALLAGIVHRAKGLPGLSTLRKNTIIRPLRVSAGMPMVEEIEANIEGCAEGEPAYTGPSVIVHRVLMLDEIAVEQRPRWDDKTNKILSACRECSFRVTLELNSATDLELFFNTLDDGDIHLATEATVAAFGALSKDPRVYNPRPCCISGTDKTEKGPEQAKFIQQILTAGHNKHTRGNITYRTISIASDGEAKRSAALVRLTMNCDLRPQSPIYPLLSVLPLMNLRVGEDEVTANKDYRHVLKTLRNLLMRLKGVKVLGCIITPALIKEHLRSAEHSQAQVNSFLNPNDKQDVRTGYQLLKALWSLPIAPSNSSPAFTYVNLMIMIKNVFFCIAKTKIDIPDREFFIILLGTDRLEVLFGLIRTAIGTDANCDIYQLCTRASHLTESTIILASRPQWDRSPRRLKLPMIITEEGEISPNADHITPAAWKGDTHMESPEDFELDPDLLRAGNSSTGRDPEDSPASTSTAQDSDSNPITDCSYNPDGDVEDVIAIAEPEGKFSPHVEINGKLIPKAKALSAMMRYRGARSSTDRLKRVVGLPSFNPTMEGSGMVSDGAFDTPALRVGNPVALVVSCEGRLYLAVAQVNNLILGSSVQSIPLDMLLDSSAQASVQILRLVPATTTDDPTEKNDWRWSLGFAATCINVVGNLIHPMNPEVSILQAGHPTYLFDSATLITAAATIHDQMRPTDFMLVPKVTQTETFPYRHKGAACFLVEHEGTDRNGLGSNPGICSKC